MPTGIPKKPGGGRRRRPTGRLTIANVTKALIAAGGIQSVAAAALKIDRSTICRFIQRHPALSQVIANVADEMNDLAEAGLIANLRKQDMSAIRYYLDNKGQSRGYGVRKMAFADGDGNIVTPAVLVTPVRELTPDAWEARHEPRT